ncbi:C-C motif chemokine 17-like [Xyrauchen texanus]|uniref:C-C motif chemokine 17-like n=1 Tax=Xyrauchen texanus TaxID=154827 RepID=UPI0022419DF8|nr:C-C motif chemokine 17-like [Xyrauchen texanus]
MFLQTVSILVLSALLFCCLEGKGVQMQRDVQCCMQYSHGKVRTKDVLRFEVQKEGPDCSIRAIILYTKNVVKCADPRDRKVKRLLRKLTQRQRVKDLWQPPHMNLPVMSEVAVVNSQKMNKTK